MKTGNYRFEPVTIRTGWLRRPREVQVLMVEVEGPIDAQMTRGRYWQEANFDDRLAYDNDRLQGSIAYDHLSADNSRLRLRLDSIAEAASRL